MNIKSYTAVGNIKSTHGSNFFRHIFENLQQELTTGPMPTYPSLYNKTRANKVATPFANSNKQSPHALPAANTASQTTTNDEFDAIIADFTANDANNASPSAASTTNLRLAFDQVAPDISLESKLSYSAAIATFIVAATDANSLPTNCKLVSEAPEMTPITPNMFNYERPLKKPRLEPADECLEREKHHFHPSFVDTPKSTICRTLNNESYQKNSTPTESCFSALERAPNFENRVDQSRAITDNIDAPTMVIKTQNTKTPTSVVDPSTPRNEPNQMSNMTFENVDVHTSILNDHDTDPENVHSFDSTPCHTTRTTPDTQYFPTNSQNISDEIVRNKTILQNHNENDQNENSNFNTTCRKRCFSIRHQPDNTEATSTIALNNQETSTTAPIDQTSFQKFTTSEFLPSNIPHAAFLETSNATTRPCTIHSDNVTTHPEDTTIQTSVEISEQQTDSDICAQTEHKFLFRHTNKTTHPNHNTPTTVENSEVPTDAETFAQRHQTQ